MKVLKSLAILAIVVLLGVLVYYKVYKTEEAKKAAREIERKLVRFDLDNIESFTLVRPDSSVVFERGMGRIWTITSPVKTEADKEPIYLLFSSLDNSDIMYTVDEDPDDLAPFGLQNPPYYMAIQFNDGSRDSLLVGNNTPDDTMTYVKFGSENRVLAVTTELTKQLKLPVNSYRSRTVFNIIPSDITSIDIYRIKDGAPEDIVLSIENGVWWMEKPWHHLGHADNITEFINDLADARREYLIDEHPDSLGQYGLQNPSDIITLTLRHNMPNKVLMLGDEVASRALGRFVYGKQLTEDLVFGTGTTVPNLLSTRSTSWFIDNQPLKFNRNIIDRIELNANNQNIVFMRDNSGNWNVVSPVDRNVPVLTIDNIFAITRFTQALELVAYNPTDEDLKRTGLDNPRIVISFFSKNQPVNKIFFGNSFTTDRQNTYFRTDISPIIYITGAILDTKINEILQSVFGS